MTNLTRAQKSRLAAIREHRRLLAQGAAGGPYLPISSSTPTHEIHDNNARAAASIYNYQNIKKF